MNEENFNKHVKISDVPLAPEEIASDANLSLAALDNQMRAEQAERDDYTMTADKLASKLPGMAIASLQLDDSTYGVTYREDDEDILKEAQAEWRASHPQK